MTQIGGIHMDEDMTLVVAVGVDANADKHPLGAAGSSPRARRRVLRQGLGDGADSGDRERSIRSFVNTESGDHEHLLAWA
jgi:hypothetical protein